MKKYYMFNKPKGCITARTDERHKTVMDYFPESLREIIFPVGRLDKDTEGLLLLTNDGILCYDLMMPERKVSKTYFFWAKGEISEEKKREIESGAAIYPGKDELTAPAKLEILEEKTLSEIKEYLSEDEQKTANRRPQLPAFSGLLTITEGKKHQVKRMLKYAGCRVVYLKRLRIGALNLDKSLPLGSYRELTEKELSALKN